MSSVLHEAFNFIEKHSLLFFSTGFSLFSTNVCKHTDFSLWHPFQTKLLFFQTIESVKCTFTARAGSGKPAFLHAFFLENENKIAEKIITGQCFPIKSKVTYKNSAAYGHIYSFHLYSRNSHNFVLCTCIPCKSLMELRTVMYMHMGLLHCLDQPQ